MEETKKKASVGRRKVEIKKIEDRERLRVSFSKRRKSLFKKVAELREKCGVEVAVIVQYPGGKIMASGEESEINPLINRYLATAGTSSLGEQCVDSSRLEEHMGADSSRLEEHMGARSLIYNNAPSSIGEI